jgi:hypothetical protein
LLCFFKGHGLSVFRLKLLLQSFDLALEILNRGVFLPQFVDSPFQRDVLLEQSLGMGFLPRVNLLGVDLTVRGWGGIGFRNDRTKWQRLSFGWPVIPISRMFAAVESMALVHLVGKIRIGISANRVCLHEFWRAKFAYIVRGIRGSSVRSIELSWWKSVEISNVQIFVLPSSPTVYSQIAKLQPHTSHGPVGTRAALAKW